MTEVERATIQRLMDENAALRRRVYNLEFEAETARQALTNAALEGQGYYVFSEDGEYEKFRSRHEAWLNQRTLQDEGMTSVLVHVLDRLQGVEQGEPYECPPRPSHDPQDVRDAA